MFEKPPEIVLHVEPGLVQTWEEFRSTNPPCSIALDGFVDAAPAYDPSGPFANFDHHRDVHRLATRSTVGQVLVAISLGLFDTFRHEGRRFAHVFVNACDQDVCLSYWLLTNAHLVSRLDLDMDIARLIIGEDLLDASAGAYPIDPRGPAMRKLAWVFEPYDEARSSQDFAEYDSEEMRRLIEKVCQRLTLLSLGQGKECELAGDYDDLGGGSGWKLIREYGTYARTKMFADGVRAFVAVRERRNGSFDYSIGRMSPFINFPLERIFKTLNETEGRCESQDRWGGSDTIGGSPRISGSQIPPEKLQTIINSVVLGNS